MSEDRLDEAATRWPHAAGVVPLAAAQEERYAREGRSIVVEVAARIARQLGGHVAQSDLESVGNEALLRLIRRYDPAVSPLSVYLRRYLRWAILDHIRGGRAAETAARRARGLAGLQALAEHSDDSRPCDEHAARWQLDQALSVRVAAMALPWLADEDAPVEPSADSSRAPDRLVSRAAMCGTLRAALARMEDAIARAVVVRHYFGDEPFEQIAEDLGLNSHQICRVHKKALDELHGHLARAGVCPESR